MNWRMMKPPHFSNSYPRAVFVPKIPVNHLVSAKGPPLPFLHRSLYHSVAAGDLSLCLGSTDVLTRRSLRSLRISP